MDRGGSCGRVAVGHTANREDTKMVEEDEMGREGACGGWVKDGAAVMCGWGGLVCWTIAFADAEWAIAWAGERSTAVEDA
jgi:hypothetical protein